MIRKKIMVVDDDVHMLESIVEVLRRKGHDTDAFSSGTESLKGFQKGMYHLVISDFKMPGLSGIELLEHIRTIDDAVPFIMITAYGEFHLAWEAGRKSADGFIAKEPDMLEKLEFAVERELKHSSIVNENRQLKSALEKRWEYVGNSTAMHSIRELIKKIAPTKASIVISGESGTGKELIARAIHFSSNRNRGPFVKINCGALPESLIESELFGHERGAFTGAIRARTGIFEQASSGTLLLDEIGDMPVSSQVKLLRVLQEGELCKVGGEEPISVDVRIVATTNRDLEREIKDNVFREDLYYRLNVFHIALPPLRERKEDIPLLVEHFIDKYNRENGLTVDGAGAGAIEKLKSHHWPGNIRELENAVERAVVLTKMGFISKDIFSFTAPNTDCTDTLNPGMSIAELEKNLIMSTLRHCCQNRTKAAGMLGISIRTLRNKLHEYNVTQ